MDNLPTNLEDSLFEDYNDEMEMSHSNAMATSPLSSYVAQGQFLYEQRRAEGGFGKF